MSEISGKPAGCIVILGAPNDKEGNLSPIAALRAAKGAEELSLHPGYKILLTGGFGSHFNETAFPHWKYARDFLVNSLAVPPDSFLPEAIESSNTVEDIEKSVPVMEKYGFPEIIFVTSAFHMPRVQYIAGIAMAPYKDRIKYAAASDESLDKEQLAGLVIHEKKAIAYLKEHYG